jgi:hypothetical protein
MAPHPQNKSASAGGSNSMLVTGFIVLHTFGWIGCTILLLTVVFSRKIQRHATWINLCLSWILFGLSFSLLFLSRQLKDFPYFPLCVTQAGLIYASQTLVAGTAVILAIHLLFSVRSTRSSPEISGPQYHRIFYVMLIILPYVTYIGVFLWVLITGLHYPDTIIMYSGMLCATTSLSPGRFVGPFVIVTMFATVSIEGIIITTFYRNWRVYRHKHRDLLATFIRVLCFTLFSALAVGISVVYIRNPNGSSTSVACFLSSLYPAAFFIIFSTQKDVLDAWMFWKHRLQRNPLPPKPLVIRVCRPGDTV